MPRVRLQKKVSIAGQVVVAWSPGVLLQYGDRWTVVDPSNDNVLIDGMTGGFKQFLLDRGFMVILEPSEVTNDTESCNPSP